MSEQITEWADMKCPECGSMDLMQLVRVRHKPGAGTNTQPAGFKCSACMTNMDMAYLIQRHELAQRRRQAERDLEEVEQMEAADPPKRGPGRPPKLREVAP